MNVAPGRFDITRDLPQGFASFYEPLHARFTPEAQRLVQSRHACLAKAHAGALPDYLSPSQATTRDWQITLPAWCRDQRNQMTGPADDAELVVKMLNSGAPGVMLDLEDSMANEWEHLMNGHANVVSALYGELTYDDRKRATRVGIKPSQTVTFVRVRGLHLSQAGILPDELTSASLFDLALLIYRLDYARLRHPLCIYIPKSESAEEALWWKGAFDALIAAKGWPLGSIACMALVEAHPLPYQMEEFLFNLRNYILGLNLGRWDYMASLIHYNLADPEWVLPDRNTIPLDVAFFQAVRGLMVDICHKHGALAIGGMTALYPSREDADLNARALAVLERDKRNEADCLMDGAWTGHPDQNAVAVAQFPYPNQLDQRPHLPDMHPNLRPIPRDVGKTTLEGTRAAVRTAIRYRFGVLEGRGASLLDGYMEDLATDRIYRLMIAQRLRFPGAYTPASLDSMFDDELTRLLAELPSGTPSTTLERYRRARDLSEQMILTGAFDPR
ncbi:MAG: aldolase/citrate lyase/malate synthase family protein [Vulcanimicrobiaceae bacterium]